MSDHLLLATLEMAVPLKIADLAHWPPDARLAHAAGCADIIAAQGDALQFGGKGCREAFAAMVRSMAVLAYQPGGVTFAGRHWCAALCDCPQAVVRGRPAKQPVVTVQVAGDVL